MKSVPILLAEEVQVGIKGLFVSGVVKATPEKSPEVVHEQFR